LILLDLLICDNTMCAISSTPVSGSLPMTDLDHGSVGLKGIIMLTSHWSMPWAVVSQEW
jgi:hypothetical protein